MKQDSSLRRNLITFQLDKETADIWFLTIGYWRESKRARKPSADITYTYIYKRFLFLPAILSLHLYRSAHSKRIPESGYRACWYGGLRKGELSHRRVPHRATTTTWQEIHSEKKGARRKTMTVLRKSWFLW